MQFEEKRRRAGRKKVNGNKSWRKRLFFFSAKRVDRWTCNSQWTSRRRSRSKPWMKITLRRLFALTYRSYSHSLCTYLRINLLSANLDYCDVSHFVPILPLSSLRFLEGFICSWNLESGEGSMRYCFFFLLVIVMGVIKTDAVRWSARNTFDMYIHIQELRQN